MPNEPDEPAPILVSATIAMGTPYVVLTFDRAVMWPGSMPAGFYFEYEGDYWWANPPGGGSGLYFTDATGKNTAIVTLSLGGTPPSDPTITPRVGYIGGPGSLTGNVTSTAGTALAQFAETPVTNITPFANFTGTPTSGSTPLSVTFSNTTNDRPNVTAWLWEKNGGGGWVNFNNYTGENPTESFTTGTWSVRLTTTGSGSIPSTQKTRTDYIVVSAPPAITLSSATATPDTGPGTITLVFSGNADNHTGFTFRIGGGADLSMSYVNGDGTNTLVFSGGTWVPSDTVYASYTPGNVTGLDPFIDYVVTIVP